MQILVGPFALVAIALFVVGGVLLFPSRSRSAGKKLLLSAVGLFVVAFVIQLAQGTPGGQISRANAALSVEQIKHQAVSYPYDVLARTPDNFKGDLVTFHGKVIQVMESGSGVTLRVNVTEGKFGWSDTILVNYRRRSPGEERILNNDMVTLWGEYQGIASYTSIFNQSIQIPHVVASVVER